MRRFILSLAVGPALIAAAAQVGGQPPPKPPVAAPPPAVADSLKALKAVGPEGAGNEAAAKAWKGLVGSGNAALIPTLDAFDGTTPTAANWLRSAVSAIADDAEQKGRTLSKDDLSKYAVDTKKPAAARRIAYDLLTKVDAKAAADLLPNFLNDPQPDLRRDAVAAKLKEAEGLTGERAPAAYRAILLNARDEDQIKLIADKLKELKAPIDLVKHYGMITEWVVSEPFDNKDGVGFNTAYEPEKNTDRTGWKYVQTNNDEGLVDVVKLIGQKKNAVRYAAATVVLDSDAAAEVRANSPNAVKLFVNGQPVYFREEYHSGSFLDQHVAAAQLKKGKNEILIKVCQNDMPQEWAQAFVFAARVTDSTGAAVPLKQVVVKDGKETTVEVGALAPPDPKKPDDKKEGK